jgi:uncharacterized SAM-binding protein YcdF (DUF218 family)
LGVLAPPVVFIALCLIGALLAPTWQRAGIGLMLVSSACLFALATPALSSALLRWVEAGLPLDLDTARDYGDAQAIVVLGGDTRAGGSDGDRLGPLSLERVVFAAEAYRRLHLPIAVSGGSPPDARTSEAGLMKAALERDFAVPVRWTEDRSRTTWENAAYTARLLQPEKLTSVVVVTQAWHMPRALWAFERAGFKPLPWSVGLDGFRANRLDDFLPSIAGLHDSYFALHELIGGFYYRLRH